MVKMKFIHTADLHLDSKIETLPSEKTKIRREETLRTFERMVDFAIENNVGAVIISGDMFDTARVTLKTKARVLNAINKANGVDFLYLSGNHDDDNFISTIEQLPKNLKIFSDRWMAYRYGDTVVSGVKFTPHNISAVYDTLELNENDINIVALHGQTASYNSSDKVETIALPKLKDKNIDYLALGHIHSYATGALDQRGVYVYSGCLDGRGFDETGEKGFVLIEVENGELSYQFIKYSSRVFREIEFCVSDYDEWFGLKDAILDKLNGECDNIDLIKVVLKGERKADFEMDIDGLSSLLNERYFFAKVYDKTELKIELSDYENDKSVRGEFVRSVWESELDNQTKQKIIACGLNALKGEI